MKNIQVIGGLMGLIFSLSAWAGEFGDHCTTGLSMGKMNKTTCAINELYKGKTYCFGNNAARDSFLLDPDNIIAKASAFYEKNKEPEREKISQADALKQIESKTCDLSNKDAGYLELDGKNLSHCKMVNTSFFGAYLRGANLSGANLQGAYLNLARLENANFSGANLQDATIFQAIFDKTNFSGANLSNARMIGTLGKVDMSGANIQKGRFGLDIGNQPMGQMKFDSVGGNFAGANFEGADLNIAAFPFGDLSGANLRGTNLHRADLTSANLTGADLTGANLSNADVDAANFKDVKGLNTVKGMESMKGKCLNCTVAALEANKEASLEPSAKTAQTDPALHDAPFCVMHAR